MEAGRDIPEEQDGSPPEAAPAPSAAEPEPAPAPAPRPPASALDSLLAGLQGGMVGVLLMLAWLGISAAWQQRSFWTAENLMASAFYGTRSIHSGFAGRTLPGLALYLALYSALGSLLALALRNRMLPVRTLLAAVMFAMAWYYVSFHWMWERMLPLVALLHAERPTAIGHVIYGLWLGRYPAYLRRAPSIQPETEPQP